MKVTKVRAKTCRQKVAALASEMPALFTPDPVTFRLSTNASKPRVALKQDRFQATKPATLRPPRASQTPKLRKGRKKRKSYSLTSNLRQPKIETFYVDESMSQDLSTKHHTYVRDRNSPGFRKSSSARDLFEDLEEDNNEEDGADAKEGKTAGKKAADSPKTKTKKNFKAIDERPSPSRNLLTI